MYRILIVDDERIIRVGLKKIIDWDEHGIEIAGEASNGLEALESFRSLKPDLVLTDIKMPVMDGFELIKEIRKDSAKTKIIIISGYDDFQYAKEALKYGVENYIIKPINKEELSSTLLGAVEKMQSEADDRLRSREDEFVIKDSILYRLVTNRISIRELKEKSDLLHIDGKDKFFSVAIVRFLKPKRSSLIDIADESSSVWDCITGVLSETAGNELNYNVFVDLNGDTVILFHSDSDSISAQTDAILRKCIQSINARLKLEAFIAVGGVQQGAESVHLSYRLASDLLQYYIIFPRNLVLTGETLERENKTRHEIFPIDKERLASLIQGGRNDDITRYFAMLHDGVSGASGLSVEQMNAFTVKLLTCLVNTIREAFPKPEGILQNYEDLFSGLLRQKTPEVLIMNAKNAALEIANLIRQNKQKPRSLTDQVIDYIANNYFNQDLSLKTISNKFGCKAPYLGQLLKRKTGELFSDYLNGVRVGYAREMLLNTHMKANEISERVGYSDPNYFYRVFKKITGTYPSDFRDVP